MADDGLPPGYKLREPAGADGLPPGYKLREPEPGKVAPAGPPSVPISTSNIDPSTLPGGGASPAPPISTANTNIPGPAAPLTEAQKGAQRIREISTSMKKGEPYNPGPLDYLVDAASLSTTRPASAFINAGVAKLRGTYPDASFEEIYKGGVDYANDRMRRAEQATGPVAPLVAGLAQIPANTVTGGFAVPASSAKMAARAAVPGFVEGASQHAGSKEDALLYGGVNAGLSAATTGVSDMIMKGNYNPAKRSAAAEATAARGRTPAEIGAEAKTHYNMLDNNGIAFDAHQTAPLYVAMHDLRNKSVYVPGANKGVDTLYDELLTKARGPMTFNDLDNSRSALSKIARSGSDTDRAAANALMGEIDRTMHAGPPAINPNNIDVATHYDTARGLARAKAMGEEAGWVADKAERKLAVNQGGDPDKEMRRNFAAVEQRVTKKDAYDPFDDKGREILSRIIRGDPMQNRMAKAGDWMQSNADKAGLSTGAAASAAGLFKGLEPGTATTAAVGVGVPTSVAFRYGGKKLEEGAATRGMDNVNRLIRHVQGDPDPVPYGATTRGDLAKIMFAQDLERLAPRVGSQYVTRYENDREDEKKKKKEKKP